MKVCWLSNYFSPYTIKQFDGIGKEVELTVVMLGGTDDNNRNSEWSMQGQHPFKLHIIGPDYNRLIRQLAKENDIFIDSMYSSKYGIIATHEFNKRNKKTILQADGGVPIDRGFFFNKIISIVMNKHQFFLSSGPHCDRYFNFYHVPKDKIYHYRFSSLTEKDLKNNEDLISKKEEIKKELNIDNKFNLISVGRPIKLKGFDILLEAYIKTGLTDKINLYIVGGKPQDEIQKIVDDNNLKNVYFIGLLNSNELNKYYVSSDAFILCTKTDVWGLVIPEAMSFGLPIITSNNCGAGVHFNLLGDNCMICGINDVDGYASYIKMLFENREKTKELGKKSLKMVKEYSLENSCRDILDILNRL